jgi:HK97 family phage portal protein
MPRWWNRLPGGANAPHERKAVPLSALTSWSQLAGPGWSRRGFASLVNEGFAKNPVVYRCVRMIAEGANRVPLVADEGGRRLVDHPAMALLSRPNPRQSGSEMLEAVYAYLQTSGNAYLEAAIVEGEVKGLFCLRPDRMRVVAGKDGWPSGYAYSAGGATRQLSQGTAPIASVLHMALFDPLDDHYGMSPLLAAQQSLDLHNAASAWNKALLDNSARPSGALVISAASGTLSEDQFQRLKAELTEGFEGAVNAGRPMVLEGGLDWKSMSLSPKDMDFIELKNAAARDIALAFGVPPMLLGIPGDNTYSNMAEANRALWRQTIIPLVRRVADDLSGWLGPAFGGVVLRADLDGVEALAEDRSALWARVTAAGFLTDDEKRKLVGVDE